MDRSYELSTFLLLATAICWGDEISTCTRRTLECPEISLWQNRSIQMDCFKLHYACLMDKDSNFVEGCFPNYEIKEGKGGCPYVDRCHPKSNLPVLAENEYHSCPPSTDGCPESNHTRYRLKDIYKYAKCVKGNEYNQKKENILQRKENSLQRKLRHCSYIIPRANQYASAPKRENQVEEQRPLCETGRSIIVANEIQLNRSQVLENDGSFYSEILSALGLCGRRKKAGNFQYHLRCSRRICQESPKNICLDCRHNAYLCMECSQKHSAELPDHDVVNLSNKNIECEKHIGMQITLYCSRCQEYRCNVCGNTDKNGDHHHPFQRLSVRIGELRLRMNEKLELVLLKISSKKSEIEIQNEKKNKLDRNTRIGEIDREAEIREADQTIAKLEAELREIQKVGEKHFCALMNENVKDMEQSLR